MTSLRAASGRVATWVGILAVRAPLAPVLPAR
jgi:hypothetical protein